MKQINNVSPLVGRKPPAVGALSHPVTHSSFVPPQTLRGQIQVRSSQAGPQQTLPQGAMPFQVQPAQKQSEQTPPKFLNQTRHRGAQSVTSAEPGQEPKLLDQVSQVLRTFHYSIRTEKAYIDWIYRFIMFHNKRHPREMGVAEISQFLTHLAVKKHVAPSTQNQALSAILFLYKHVLRMDLGRVEFPYEEVPKTATRTTRRQEIGGAIWRGFALRPLSLRSGRQKKAENGGVDR